MARLRKDTTIDDISLIDFIYPIGSIYMTEDETFDPANHWGGKWEKIIDRFLMVQKFLKKLVVRKLIN